MNTWWSALASCTADVARASTQPMLESDVRDLHSGARKNRVGVNAKRFSVSVKREHAPKKRGRARSAHLSSSSEDESSSSSSDNGGDDVDCSAQSQAVAPAAAAAAVAPMQAIDVDAVAKMPTIRAAVLDELRRESLRALLVAALSEAAAGGMPSVDAIADKLMAQPLRYVGRIFV